MTPFHYKLGPLAISPVEIFIVLGIALGAAVARKRMAEAGATWADLFDFGLAVLVGGALGARLYYFVPLWLRGLQSGSELVASWSEGSGFYGALIGGAAGLATLARIKKLPVLKILDATALVMPIGFASGKIGCFFAGCCYGKRCDGFPGLRFPPGSLAYDTQREAGEIPARAASSLPVHPAQLYELAFAAVLFAVLWWLGRRSKRPGEVTLAMACGYSAWRFAIEFLRDDPGRHGFNAGISDSQVMALVVMAVSAVLWILLRRREPAAPPPTPAQ